MDSLITVMKGCFFINLILTLVNHYIREDEHATRICIFLMIASFVLILLLTVNKGALR